MMAKAAVVGGELHCATDVGEEFCERGQFVAVSRAEQGVFPAGQFLRKKKQWGDAHAAADQADWLFGCAQIKASAEGAEQINFIAGPGFGEQSGTSAHDLEKQTDAAVRAPAVDGKRPPQERIKAAANLNHDKLARRSGNGDLRRIDGESEDLGGKRIVGEDTALLLGLGHGVYIFSGSPRRHFEQNADDLARIFN
ncbi:hypothetical protein LDFHOB_08310 [Candidatus Electronema aureum]